jgi:hypothetical protein
MPLQLWISRMTITLTGAKYMDKRLGSNATSYPNKQWCFKSKSNTNNDVHNRQSNNAATMQEAATPTEYPPPKLYICTLTAFLMFRCTDVLVRIGVLYGFSYIPFIDGISLPTT